MIKIKLYKNGFEVIGHSTPHTCGEVSILAWSYTMTIYRLDSSSRYYSSKNDDDPKRQNDGYTWMIFDPGNFMAKWMYEEYEINLKEWAKELWKERVEIVDVDDVFVPLGGGKCAE